MTYAPGIATSGAKGCRPPTSCSTDRRADLLHHGTGMDGPPRGRTSLDGFGDRPGRWTAAPGAPCGNRTRIAGLEDRHSAVELKAPENVHPRRGRDGRSPPRPSAPRFRPDCHKAPRSAPGRTRWRRIETNKKTPMVRDRANKKTPRPFERGVLTNGFVVDQIMPSPRARATFPRPCDPTTYSPCRCRRRRTPDGEDGEGARFGIRRRSGFRPFWRGFCTSCCPL